MWFGEVDCSHGEDGGGIERGKAAVDKDGVVGDVHGFAEGYALVEVYCFGVVDEAESCAFEDDRGRGYCFIDGVLEGVNHFY